MTKFRLVVLMLSLCFAPSRAEANWLESYFICQKASLEAGYDSIEFSAAPDDSKGNPSRTGKAITILPDWDMSAATHLLFDGKIYKLSRVTNLQTVDDQEHELRLSDQREPLRLRRKGFSYDSGKNPVVSASVDNGTQARATFRKYLIASFEGLKTFKASDVIPRLEKCRARLSATDNDDALILRALENTISFLRRRSTGNSPLLSYPNAKPKPKPRSSEDMQNLRDWQDKHAIPWEMRDTYLTPEQRYH